MDVDELAEKESSNNDSKQDEVAKIVETVVKKTYADKKNYCFYCDKDVTHFVRHILNWHPSEIAVQEISSLPSKSKRRRELVTTLRKKGNFISNRTSDVLRPVKRLKANDISSDENYLPCKYCLGYYKKKSLYRHTKKCSENTDVSNRRQTAQSDGQMTQLAGELGKRHKLLREELFPHMRADKISFIAKKDLLICQYAYSYIKGRKTKGNFDLVRQNMRRLAKLLQFCEGENSKIKNLFDLLKPLHFGLILKGVYHIANYNPETDIFESPTLAMNFGTLIKKCCDIAYIHLVQKYNTSAERKDLKILKKLIESQWADEISAQAGLNLNEKKWNKQELLPLTSDLKKLNIFLEKCANESFQLLNMDPCNFDAYNTLKETIYTQIILLNRRRPAEVAQIKIDAYQTILTNETINNSEFLNCLSETEQILMNSFSRIVIRGKRGRGVPILLSPKMKQHFDYLVSKHNNFVKDNKYIFHTGGKGCFDGTKILYKYAEKSGIHQPKNITATKLRKHLATITQLLQFQEKDLEQLSQFMGHTLKTHCDVYRLSDNMYQTAKVSKLLLLMREGGIEQFQGKKLDDIDIDLSPILEEDTLTAVLQENGEGDVQENSEATPEVLKRKPICRKLWTSEQKKTIAQYFSDHIKNKRSPKKREIMEFIRLYPNKFENRIWTTIKAVVFNMYTGKLNINI